MKKIYTTIYFIFIVSIIHGQIIEKQYFTWRWKSTSEKKAFFVREIKKINDTLYYISDYDNKGRLQMKGEYSSIHPMIENGYFEFFDLENFKKVATGFYTDGSMSGTWNFTNYNSGITKEVNYNLKLINSDSSSEMVFVDEMPKFRNSDNLQYFSDYIGENLIYPPMALRYFIEGKVILQFKINELGQVSDIKVMQKAYKDLEKEAIRVLNESPNWTAGKLEGKVVKVLYVFPFIFKLK